MDYIQIYRTGVRLGEWDTETERDCDNGDCSDPVVDIVVEQLIPHEGYNTNSKTQENDIALLRLAQPVTFTDWIKPICLPTSSNLRSISYDGINLEVAGWGKTENGKVCFQLDMIFVLICVCASNTAAAQSRSATKNSRWTLKV